jgi:hypothetical protein
MGFSIMEEEDLSAASAVGMECRQTPYRLSKPW